eukprot:1232796-Rhodomonas_salina.1
MHWHWHRVQLEVTSERGPSVNLKRIPGAAQGLGGVRREACCEGVSASSVWVLSPSFQVARRLVLRAAASAWALPARGAPTCSLPQSLRVRVRRWLNLGTRGLCPSHSASQT